MAQIKKLITFIVVFLSSILTLASLTGSTKADITAHDCEIIMAQEKGD